MKLTAYQRRQVDYVKANVRGMVQRRRPEMTRAELRITNEESDVKAMTWLDSTVPRWREGKPPKTNKIYVTVRKDDKDEDDEY